MNEWLLPHCEENNSYDLYNIPLELGEFLTSPRLYTVSPPSTMGKTGLPEESSEMGCTNLRTPPSATFLFLQIFFMTKSWANGIALNLQF